MSGRLAVFFFMIHLLGACHVREAPQRYLFLGHPYDWADTSQVDPRLERLDYSPYKEIWLGGDVCVRWSVCWLAGVVTPWSCMQEVRQWGFTRNWAISALGKSSLKWEFPT